MDKNSAVFGGTFNPIHLGHLGMIKFALKNTDIQTVTIVPSGNPPFKTNKNVAPSSDRLNMIKIALIDFKKIYGESLYNRIDIETYEIEKTTKSYTSESIKYFKDKYRLSNRIPLIIGTDILKNLSNWHDFEYLKANVKFILLKRKTDAVYNIYINNLKEMGCLIDEYNNDEIDISSTDVRNGYLDGVTDGVREYIIEKKLYVKK